MPLPGLPRIRCKRGSLTCAQWGEITRVLPGNAPVRIVPAVWLNGRLKQQVEPPCMAQPAASSFTLSSAILRLYGLGVDHPLEDDGAIGVHVHADNVAIHEDALQKGV